MYKRQEQIPGSQPDEEIADLSAEETDEETVDLSTEEKAAEEVSDISEEKTSEADDFDIVTADTIDPVSYTHLDVYKRQYWQRSFACGG